MINHVNCPACNSDSKRVKWEGALFYVVCLVCGFYGQTASSEDLAWQNWDNHTRRLESYRTDG